MLVCSQTGYNIVVDRNKLPIRVSLDVFGIELDLIFQTALLLFMVGTNPAIRGPKLLISNRCRFFTLWDLYNIFRHNKTSMYFAHTLMSSITWRFPHEKLYKEKLHFSLDYKAKMQLPTCPPGTKRRLAPQAGPQKVGSDRDPLRGRLQPSRRAERDLLRKRRSSGMSALRFFQ